MVLRIFLELSKLIQISRIWIILKLSSFYVFITNKILCLYSKKGCIRKGENKTHRPHRMHRWACEPESSDRFSLQLSLRPEDCLRKTHVIIWV